MGRFNVSMFEYCKIVLEKLSFNRLLFKKEYRKSLRFLEDPEDQTRFRRWARQRFGRTAARRTDVNSVLDATDAKSYSPKSYSR